MNEWRDNFFVGWAGRLPRAHVWFLARVCGGALLGFVLLAVALARSIDDPGTGGFDWDAGEMTLRGVATALPYPALRLPDGHAILLAGVGKSGVDLPSSVDGHMVEARGVMIRRGTLEMLQVNGDLHAVDGTAAPASPEQLGRWRITGEICDGKCESGAMRPGNGIAHRACANLCLIGGVPPVFVTTAPVEGTSFLLLGDTAGAALPDLARDLVGLRVVLEGSLERRADLLVFKADISRAVVP
jgi:hypothetical protein